MKKITFILSTLLLLVSCGGGKTNKNEGISISSDSLEVLKLKSISEIKSWGAKDAFFDDDNYFVYGVEPEDISGSADDVAEAMFPNVEHIPSIKGCKVMNITTKEIIGKYVRE